MAPVDCHRACAPPNDEPLFDNCFERGDSEAGEQCENVDEPVRLDAGDVGDPEGDSTASSVIFSRS